MVARETGRISWPAVNKTRLTQFGTGLGEVSVDFAGSSFLVGFSAVGEPGADTNVELRLRERPSDPQIVVRAGFDLESVFLRHPILPPNSEGRPRVQSLGRLLHDHTDEVAAALAGRLLEPFQYAKNRSGGSPSSFFGRGRTRFRIWLYRRGDHHFLVVE